MLTLILGLVIDAVVPPLLDANYNQGVGDSPFGAVLTTVKSTAWAIVPVLLFGIIAWMVWGTVQEERREDRRRVR